MSDSLEQPTPQPTPQPTSQPEPSSQPTSQPTRGPSFTNWMGSLWGYTILRFGLFFAIWGILLLVGLGGLLAALLALVLSVPLSLLLLAGPRNRVAQNMEARIEASRANRRTLDEKLDPRHDDED